MSFMNTELDEETEKKFTNLVHQLCDGISNGTYQQSLHGGAKSSVKLLAKMRNKYDTHTGSVAHANRTIMEHAPNPAAYQAKYNLLKEQGIRHLDRYVTVISKIVADKQVREFLTDHRREDSMRTSATGSEVGPSSPTHSGFTTYSSQAYSAADAFSPSTSSYRQPPPVSTQPWRAEMSGDVPPSPADAAARAIQSPSNLPLTGMEGIYLRDNPAFSPASSPSAPRQREPQRQQEPPPLTQASAVPYRRLDLTSTSAPSQQEALPLRSPPGPGPTSPGLLSGLPLVPAAASHHRDLEAGKDYPDPPTWLKSQDGRSKRPYLTGEHLFAAAIQNQGDRPSLRQFADTVSVQEILIMEDLLFAMLGIEGKYIRVVPENPSLGVRSRARFTLDKTGFDGSMYGVVEELLPLCGHVVAIQQFIEATSMFEHGLVSQALAAALRVLVQDWQTMVAQLEHQHRIGHLSLQAMKFYCEPASKALGLLAHLCSSATSAGKPMRGAVLLNALDHVASEHAGDKDARNVLLRLLKAAAVPYCRMLERWVYEGAVEDPYDEFMIVERTDLHRGSLSTHYNSKYWTERYTLRDIVPAFLQGSASKILTTGKYLNAVRECDRQCVFPDASSSPIQYEPARRGHEDAIDAAFHFASGELTKLVMQEHSLMARLRSVKLYFLIDQGDYMVHFMDIAAQELSKFRKEISVSRLQSLLELSLRISVASADPHNEDLSCSLEKESIVNQLLHIRAVDGPHAAPSAAPPDATPGQLLPGYETFVLDYQVQWPVSLVLSKKALTKYQLLFRHLFYCKHVERQLSATWQQHQGTRRVSTAGGALARSYLLCQRMLHFMQNFEYYMTVEVLSPNWHIMEDKLKQAHTIDEVMEVHEEFLDKSMSECMLFQPKILRKLEKIKALCLQFVQQSERLVPATCTALPPSDTAPPGKDEVERTKAKMAAERRHQHEALAHARMAAAHDHNQRPLDDLEKNFYASLDQLLRLLNENLHIDPNAASLCSRLDFNNFFRYQ